MTERPLARITGLPDLLERRRQLLLRIAEDLGVLGLSTTAYLHGSQARREGTYVLAPEGVYLASDIDLFVNGSLSEEDCKILNSRYTSWYQAEGGGFATPAAKVSVLSNQQYDRTPEREEMRYSALQAGVPVWAVLTSDGRAVARERPHYGFGVPYAALRWCRWVGTGSAGDVAALYEVTKAFGRHCGVSSWAQNKTVWTNIDLLRREAAAFVMKLTDGPLGLLVRPIGRWVESEGEAAAGEVAALRGDCWQALTTLSKCMRSQELQRRMEG